MFFSFNQSKDLKKIVTKPQSINSENFSNLYKLNDSVYRSEQPNKKGMQELEKLGLKTIINLRNRRNDNKEAKGTNLNLIHLPINTWKFNYNDILISLKELEKAEKPVLVHCLHGSDRTGAVIASYRIVYEGWTKADAIAEFQEEQFGYHEKWFPKILSLLESLDVEKLKTDLK